MLFVCLKKNQKNLTAEQLASAGSTGRHPLTLSLWEKGIQWFFSSQLPALVDSGVLVLTTDRSQPSWLYRAGPEMSCSLGREKDFCSECNLALLFPRSNSGRMRNCCCSKGDGYLSSALCTMCCAPGSCAAALLIPLVTSCLSTSRSLYLPVLPASRLQWWSEN